MHNNYSAIYIKNSMQGTHLTMVKNWKDIDHIITDVEPHLGNTDAISIPCQQAYVQYNCASTKYDSFLRKAEFLTVLHLFDRTIQSTFS